MRESGRLSIYNLGVHVHDLRDSRFGTGGIVVSRRQLLVNIARNEVLHTCPVWNRIARAVDQRAKTQRRTTELTDAERRSIADAIVAGTYDAGDVAKLKLLMDVRSDWWSPESVQRYVRKHGIRAITVAPRYAPQADAVMQFGIAFVVAEQGLDLFGLESLSELLSLLATHEGAGALRHVEVIPFETAKARIPADGRIIPEREWTRTQRMMMEFLSRMQRYITRPLGQRPRTLRLADGNSRNGWTDGTTYIALNHYLLPVNGQIVDWHQIGHTLLHEYCHGDSTVNTHVHGAEFYRQYHDRYRELALFVHECVLAYPRALEQAKLTLNKNVARLMDAAARVERERAALSQIETTLDGLRPPPSPVEAPRSAKRQGPKL